MTAARRFRYRALEPLRGWRGALLLAALLLAFPLLVLFPLRHHLAGFYGTLGAPSPALLAVGAALGGLLVLFVAVARALFAMRLEVDGAGLRFRSGWPPPFATLADWELGWHQVRAARAEPVGALAPLLRGLTLTTAAGARRLRPWQWVDPDDAADLALTADVMRAPRIDPRAQARAWEETAFVRLLVERGLLELDAPPAADPDDVQSSPTAIGLAVAMAAAVLYAVVDIYFGLDEYYAGRAPLELFVVLGAVAGVLGWRAFAPAHRAKREAALIALMFGFGVGLGSYPLLLRANAWTDRDGLREHEYLLTEGGRWVALDHGAPTLTFDIGTGYWRQFEPGTRKTFRLRRGGLGFHQVDMAPIYAEQRAFYRDAD